MRRCVRSSRKSPARPASRRGPGAARKNRRASALRSGPPSRRTRGHPRESKCGLLAPPAVLLAETKADGHPGRSHRSPSPVRTTIAATASVIGVRNAKPHASSRWPGPRPRRCAAAPLRRGVLRHRRAKGQNRTAQAAASARVARSAKPGAPPAGSASQAHRALRLDGSASQPLQCSVCGLPQQARCRAKPSRQRSRSSRPRRLGSPPWASFVAALGRVAAGRSRRYALAGSLATLRSAAKRGLPPAAAPRRSDSSPSPAQA